MGSQFFFGVAFHPAWFSCAEVRCEGPLGGRNAWLDCRYTNDRNPPRADSQRGYQALDFVHEARAGNGISGRC